MKQDEVVVVGAGLSLLLPVYTMGILRAWELVGAQSHGFLARFSPLRTEPLVIPSPVLVEVDYWIHQRLHPGILVALLDDIDADAYRVEDLLPGEYRRVHELCDQYADSDIDFVDAAVLAITERLQEPKLATLDRRHFGLLRPRHVRMLQLLPESE